MKDFKKLFFYFLMLIFLVGNTYALNINIFGEIKEYSKIYNENVQINLNCGEELNLTLPKKAEEIYFNGKKINGKTIFINNCKAKNIISYDLDKLEILKDGHVRIERNFLKYKNINYTYSLFLPLDYEININESIPNKFNTVLKNNKKLINFQKNNVYLIYLLEVDDEPALILAHFIKEFEEPAALILLFVFYILGVISAYFYFIYFQRKEEKEIIVPSFVLDKGEKEVLNVIRENPGINQKHIGDKLNMSKSRVSMFINELEDKLLIRRERFGRSYKVFIEKKVV